MGAECGFYAFERPSPDPATDNTLQIDGSRVFLCPEVPDRTNIRNTAYGYNYQFLGNARFKGGQEANGFIRFPVKIEHINPSATVMAADNLGTAAGKPLSARTEYRVDGGGETTAVGNHAWSLDPPRLTATSDYCDDANRAPEHRSAPDTRHHGRFNALYCDGHVTTSTLEALGYVVDPDGRVAVDGPTATNRFFSGRGVDEDPPPIQ